MEKQRRRRVHGEPTGWVGTECVVVFIGRAWTEQAMETRPGVPQNGGNGLVFDRPRSKRDPVHREGSGVPQNGGNGPPTVETGVLFIGRGVAYRKTGLHGILFISTVDLLQPPRATVHPPSTSSSLHLRLFIHGLLFIQPPPRATPPATVQPPLHRLLFIQPSTVYCSSSPPHHGVMFNHPSAATPPPSTVHAALHTTGSCSSIGNATAHCSSKPPATLTVHPRGSIDRLQLAAVAKESLDRVQLTAIDRSLGFSNA